MCDALTIVRVAEESKAQAPPGDAVRDNEGKVMTEAQLRACTSSFRARAVRAPRVSPPDSVLVPPQSLAS